MTPWNDLPPSRRPIDQMLGASVRTLFCSQDGADFYVSVRDGGRSHVIRAPIRVRDFDISAAQEARRWFQREMRRRRVLLVWRM